MLIKDDKVIIRAIEKEDLEYLMDSTNSSDLGFMENKTIDYVREAGIRTLKSEYYPK